MILVYNMYGTSVAWYVTLIEYLYANLVEPWSWCTTCTIHNYVILIENLYANLVELGVQYIIMWYWLKIPQVSVYTAVVTYTAVHKLASFAKITIEATVSSYTNMVIHFVCRGFPLQSQNPSTCGRYHGNWSGSTGKRTAPESGSVLGRG